MATKTKEHQPSEVLSLRDKAKSDLLEIRTIDDAISYLNKLKSIDVWVKCEIQDAELSNLIAEQKLRTQRILGELISESQRKGLLATQSEHGKGIQASVTEIDTRKTIADYGLTRQKSAAFKAIAEIPQEKFEEFIQEKKNAVNDAVAELTTAGALRLARSIYHGQDVQPEPEPTSPIPFNEDFSTDDQVKELADWINQKFTKEQKAALITLIYPH